MKILFPLGLLAATAANAATPTPAKMAAPGSVPSVGIAPAPGPVRFPGVSDAGNAILTKAQTTPDPQLQSLARQLKTVRDQLTSAVMAPTIDLDKIAGILRQQDTVQTQIRQQQTEHWITTLKQLPDEDRGTVLRTLLLSRTRQAASATAAPASPQP
jgi:hypothetical protein